MSADTPPSASGPAAAADLYLDLLKRCLTRTAFPERWKPYRPRRLLRRAAVSLATAFSKRPLELVERARFDADARAAGRDWPTEAETMVGRKRLDQLEAAVKTVVAEGVPGDLLEAGVWRGGAVILMRAVLQVLGDRDRLVWAADSFEGLPKPDPARYPADVGLDLTRHTFLAVSLEAVKENLARYGMLDDRVRFLPGWFEDTLPKAPVTRLAVLRLDGDLYESTWQALDALYPRLSVGGFAIVDDYGAVPACRRATDEWRVAHGSVEPLTWIDGDGVFWRRAV